MKILVCATLLLLVGCASSEGRVAPAVPGNPHGSIRFRVFMVTGDPARPELPWPLAGVYVASQNGRSLLGLTDQAGLVTIPKDRIWVSGARRLFFCLKDARDCSVIDIEDEALRSLDEYSVEISVPPIAVE